MKNEGRTAPPAEIAQVFAFVAGSNLIPPLKVMDSHVHSGSGMEIFRQKLYGLMQIIICQR